MLSSMLTAQPCDATGAKNTHKKGKGGPKPQFNAHYRGIFGLCLFNAIRSNSAARPLRLSKYASSFRPLAAFFPQVRKFQQQVFYQALTRVEVAFVQQKNYLTLASCDNQKAFGSDSACLPTHLWWVASGYRKNDSSPTFLGPCLAFLFPNANFTTWSPSIISIDLGKEQSHHAISKMKQKYNNKFKIDTTK